MLGFEAEISPEVQLGARLRSVPGADALLFGPVVAELLDLSASSRAELLHDGLLFGGAGVQQLKDFSAHLHTCSERRR